MDASAMPHPIGPINPPAMGPAPPPPLNASVPLTPTYTGFIANTIDAVMLFQACIDGTFTHIPRRPHDRERSTLIRSGSVFIYEENASGIKRWTDGINWSPSRILGNFLIYRELETPFNPGEKKRAFKKVKKTGGVSRPQARPTSNNLHNAVVQTGLATGQASPNSPETEEDPENRPLIGSLIDSYPFKKDGLVKKTISITFRGVVHHLVSYYSLDDVKHGRLRVPGTDPSLSTVMPRPDLVTSQNFRAPIDELELRGGDYHPNVIHFLNVLQPFLSANRAGMQYAVGYSMPQELPPAGAYPPAPAPNGLIHHHDGLSSLPMREPGHFHAQMAPQANELQYGFPPNSQPLNGTGHFNGTVAQYVADLPYQDHPAQQLNVDDGQAALFAPNSTNANGIFNYNPGHFTDFFPGRQEITNGANFFEPGDEIQDSKPLVIHHH